MDPGTLLLLLQKTKSLLQCLAVEAEAQPLCPSHLHILAQGSQLGTIQVICRTGVWGSQGSRVISFLSLRVHSRAWNRAEWLHPYDLPQEANSWNTRCLHEARNSDPHSLLGMACSNPYFLVSNLAACSESLFGLEILLLGIHHKKRIRDVHKYLHMNDDHSVFDDSYKSSQSQNGVACVLKKKTPKLWQIQLVKSMKRGFSHFCMSEDKTIICKNCNLAQRPSQPYTKNTSVSTSAQKLPAQPQTVVTLAINSYSQTCYYYYLYK